MLMTRHHRDLGSASDWLNQISYEARPTRNTTQIWEMTLHQYGISAFVSQTSFGGETSGRSLNVGCFLRLEIKQYDKGAVFLSTIERTQR